MSMMLLLAFDTSVEILSHKSIFQISTLLLLLLLLLVSISSLLPALSILTYSLPAPTTLPPLLYRPSST
jgi:hypothetical protein